MRKRQSTGAVQNLEAEEQTATDYHMFAQSSVLKSNMRTSYLLALAVVSVALCGCAGTKRTFGHSFPEVKAAVQLVEKETRLKGGGNPNIVETRDIRPGKCRVRLLDNYMATFVFTFTEITLTQIEDRKSRVEVISRKSGILINPRRRDVEEAMLHRISEILLRPESLPITPLSPSKLSNP